VELEEGDARELHDGDVLTLGTETRVRCEVRAIPDALCTVAQYCVTVQDTLINR
jgi:hypothetical protein